MSASRGGTLSCNSTDYYVVAARHEIRAILPNRYSSARDVQVFRFEVINLNTIEDDARPVVVVFNGENADKGLSCVNATGVSLSSVTIDSHANPPFDFDTVTNLDLLKIGTTQPVQSAPVVRLTNVSDGAVQLCSAAQGTKSFLELKGTANRNIALIANRFPEGEHAVTFVEGASKSAITKET